MRKFNQAQITQMFLRGRFSPPTEEKVQRWLVDNDDEQASREFWESLSPKPAARRRWVGIAATAAVVLSAAAGVLVHHNLDDRREQPAPTAAETTAAPAALLHPLIFERATAQEIFDALEERFDVDIIVDNQLLDSPELYTIKFPKGDNLTAILHVLQDVMDDFTYTRTGNKIKITM